MSKLRKLILGSSWLGMTTQAKVSITDKIQFNTGGMEWLLSTTPKIQAMLPISWDQVVFKKEKSLVWTYFPGEEVHISAALTETGIDHAFIHAGQTARDEPTSSGSSTVIPTIVWYL